MLLMIRMGGRARPVFACDVCHKPIVQVALGVVVCGLRLQEGDVGPAALVHRGTCMDTAQMQLGDAQGIAPWMEFNEFINGFLSDPSNELP